MARIIHMADCHIGSWRDPKLTELNFKYFSYVIEYALNNSIDVVLISGDLFNTSLPSIEYVDRTVKELMKLKNNNIAVYAIAGSHDYSPSGKTMLKIFESAGLLKNVLIGKVSDKKLCLDVFKDEKYKLLLSGMFGKKGTLETYYYEALDRNYITQQLSDDYYKIFLFHSAITEIKPESLENMPSAPMSFLPKGFNYYAGGHVHYRFSNEFKDYGKIVFPGPTFPNNFKELYDLKTGSFVVLDTDTNSEKTVEIKLKEVLTFNVNLKDKTPDEINEYLIDYFKEFDIVDKIVLIRLYGKVDGLVGDINFRNLLNFLEHKKPFCILKNSFSLQSNMDEIKDIKIGSLDDIEDKLISENSDDVSYVHSLLKIFNSEKQEGETISSFEERLFQDLNSIICSKEN